MGRIKRFIYENIIHISLLSVGLLICTLSVWNWFSDGSILFFVDSLLPIEPKNSFLRMFYNFNSHIFPWNSEPSWSWGIYWFMISAGKEVFHSLSLSQYLLYVFLLFSSLTGLYFLTNYLWFTALKNKENVNVYRIVIFLFALLYTFNLYTFYYGFFMFNPNAFIIAFLPLNLLSLFKIYSLLKEKPKVRSFWIILFVLTALLMSSGFGTYIFLAQYLVWVFLYLIIYFVISKKSFLEILSILIFLAIIFLSQWWWFLPALLGFKDLYEFQSSTGTISWFLSGYLPAQLLNSLRILGLPFLVSNAFSWSDLYQNNKIFTFPLFLLPSLLLFFVYILKKLRNRITFIYLLIMLIGSLFIVKFNNPPFSFILGFSFEHVPYFGAFREFYQKAGLYYILPYLLICSLASGLIIRILLQKKNKLALSVFVLLLLINIVIITGPFFIFSYDNIRTERFTYNHTKYTIKSKTKIPKEYYDFKKVFEPECKGRAVMIIPRSAWVSSANWFKYGTSYMATDLLSEMVDCSFLTTLALKFKAEASNQAFFVLLQNDEYNELKRLMYKTQISYILLRYDNTPYYFSIWQYIDPRSVAKKLDQDPDFEKKVINEYFTVYKFKKAKDFDKHGFALHSSGTYTSSPLTRSTDYALASRMLPDVIGPVLVNTQKDLTKFMSSIGAYLSMGFCSDCATKAEIERLESGTQKKLILKLDVEQGGDYSCISKVYIPGSEVTNIDLTDLKGKKTAIDTSQPVKLEKGSYTADISYSTQTFIDKKSILLDSGEVLELPIGKLYDRSYKLSYTLDNKDQDVNIIFAKKPIDLSDIKRDKFNPADIAFTSPTGGSDKKQKVQRIFQVDEFNVNNYYLYIRVNTLNPLKKSTVVIGDLLLERAIDINYVGFACYLKTGEDDHDLTNMLKVTRITPLEYKVILPNGFNKGFLTFNKTYADDWQAYTTFPDGKKEVYPHLQNGYSNAWFIENPKSKVVTMVLTRHGLVKKNGIITLILLFFALGIYIWIMKKK